MATSESKSSVPKTQQQMEAFVDYGYTTESEESGLEVDDCLNSMLEDEDSFAVLGKHFTTSIQAAVPSLYTQIQQKSLLSEEDYVTSSITVATMEKQIQQLIQENMDLKKTSIQNNLASQEQLKKFQSLQAEMQELELSHNQKLVETQSLVDQLKKENSELETKATQELARKQSVLGEMLKLEWSYEQKLRENRDAIDQLKKENLELKTKASHDLSREINLQESIKDSRAENQKLSDAIGCHLKEIDRLKADIVSANAQTTALEQRTSQQIKSVANEYSAKEKKLLENIKSIESKAYRNRLEERNANVVLQNNHDTLARQLKSIQEQSLAEKRELARNIEYLQAENENLKYRLSVSHRNLEAQRDQFSTEKRDLNGRIRNLKAEIEHLEESLEDMSEDMASLKNSMKSMRREHRQELEQQERREKKRREAKQRADNIRREVWYKPRVVFEEIFTGRSETRESTFTD